MQLQIKHRYIVPLPPCLKAIGLFVLVIINNSNLLMHYTSNIVNIVKTLFIRHWWTTWCKGIWNKKRSTNIYIWRLHCIFQFTCATILPTTISNVLTSPILLYLRKPNSPKSKVFSDVSSAKSKPSNVIGLRARPESEEASLGWGEVISNRASLSFGDREPMFINEVRIS